VWLADWVKANRPAVEPVRAVMTVRDLAPVAPLPADPEIPEGRYAIMIGPEKPFFFWVQATPVAGRLLIREQISDDYYALRHPRDRVVGGIMRDREQAGRDYARWLGKCRRCGKQLTDHLNPHFERGFGPDCGAIVPE
jgi:hypothetical protein